MTRRQGKGHRAAKRARWALAGTAAGVLAALVILPGSATRDGRFQRLHASSVPSESGLTLVGQVGGPTRAAAVAGDTAFVGRGPRVHVFAVCHPEVPIHTGESGVLPGPVLDVLVRGRYLYAALGAGGLAVLDVSRPEQPEVLRTVPLYGVAARLVPEGDRLYVVSGYGGLRILSLEDPAVPRELGHFQAVVSDAAVRGDFAYVVKRDFTVVDVSDPTAPRQLRKLADWADSVALQHATMVVAVSSSVGGGAREGALQVFDVTDPRTPRARGSLPIGPPARLMRFTGSGGTLLAFQPTFARVVDVADADRPRDVDGFATYGTVVDADDAPVGVEGEVAYWLLSAGPRGLRIVDRYAIPPAEVWFDEPVANAKAVAAADGVAYVEDEGEDTHVRVFDLRVPEAPHEMAQLALEVAHEAMAATGGRLYVGDPEGVIHVVDVGDAPRPRPVGRLDLAEPIWDLAVGGERVVVAADEHVRVIDATKASQPLETGSAIASGGATALGISGDVAYVTGPSTGLDTGRPSLMAFDIATPGRVRELGVMPDAAGWRHGVAVRDRSVYIDGLQVVDASDPAAMRETARLALEGETRALAVAEERLYAAQRLTGGGRLLEFDTLAADAPAERASIDIVDEALDVTMLRGYALVAAKEAGLVVIATDGAQPPMRPTPSTALEVAAYLPVVTSGPLGAPCP